MIKIVDLWKSYGKLEVLKGLNLEIEDKETLVILGRSGVGKSVLLKQIIGIETPDKGYIEINNVKINDQSSKKRMQAMHSMGMLFQGSALFDSMTIGENIAFYLRQHESKIGEKEIQHRVDHALERVGLAGTQKKLPSELSGGMRKRAGLARLIVYKPRIILYDEPTTGLDPVTAMQINDLITQTQKELEATSIVVTHDIVSALKLTQNPQDRLAFHEEGKIAHIAPKNEFLKIDDPKLQAFFKNSVINTPDLKQFESEGKE